jgi:hypothetical protein
MRIPISDKLRIALCIRAFRVYSQKMVYSSPDGVV